jgi:hypothetical protein
MAGFNVTPPPGFQPPPGPQMLPFNPQQALAAFRPPPPMSMGQMPGMNVPQQQQGGFGMQQGAGMLSGALSGFRGMGGANANTSPGMAGRNDSSGFGPAYAFLGGPQGAAGMDAFMGGMPQGGVGGLDSLFSGMPSGGSY